MSDDWIKHFMEVAILFASRSKDPSTKVGAVIVDTLRRVISTGYNGFPRRVCDDPARYENRQVKYAMIVHAEANAILNSRCADLGGAILVTTKPPCTECSKLIIQSGITQIYAPLNDHRGSKWADDWLLSEQMLREAGVVVTDVELPRRGRSMREHYETGLRSVQDDLRRRCTNECDFSTDMHSDECREVNLESAHDTISRLLRGECLT